MLNCTKIKVSSQIKINEMFYYLKIDIIFYCVFENKFIIFERLLFQKESKWIKKHLFKSPEIIKIDHDLAS